MRNPKLSDYHSLIAGVAWLPHWSAAAPAATAGQTITRSEKRNQSDERGFPARPADSAAVHLRRRERFAAAGVEWRAEDRKDNPPSSSTIRTHLEAVGYIGCSYNVPADNIGFVENVPMSETLKAGGFQGKNDFGKIGYGGPCPPSGTHRYFFKLYAVDAELPLKAGATWAELEKALDDHVVAQGQLMGTYSR